MLLLFWPRLAGKPGRGPVSVARGGFFLRLCRAFVGCQPRLAWPITWRLVQGRERIERMLGELWTS